MDNVKRHKCWEKQTLGWIKEGVSSKRRNVYRKREKIVWYCILFKKKKVNLQKQMLSGLYCMLVLKGNAIVSYNFVVFPIKVSKLKQITTQRMQELVHKVTWFNGNAVFNLFSMCLFMTVTILWSHHDTFLSDHRQKSIIRWKICA